MMKTVFTSLYIVAVLSFGAIAIPGSDPYTGLLFLLFVNGFGLAVLLHAVHGQQAGVVEIPPHRISRERNGLMFRVILILMGLLGVMLTVVGLMILASM